MSNLDPNLTDAQILALKTDAATMEANSPEQQMAVSIVRTLSKNLSDAEWVGLYRGVPPQIIPLSPRQLEAVHGGLTVGDILDGWPFPPWPGPIDPNPQPF